MEFLIKTKAVLMLNRVVEKLSEIMNILTDLPCSNNEPHSIVSDVCQLNMPMVWISMIEGR